VITQNMEEHYYKEERNGQVFDLLSDE